MKKIREWFLYKTYISPLKYCCVIAAICLSAMMTERFDWYLTIAGIAYGKESNLIALCAWYLPIMSVLIVTGMAVSEEVTKRKYMVLMRFTCREKWKNFIRNKVLCTSFILSITNVIGFAVFRACTYADFLQDNFGCEDFIIALILYVLHVVVITLIQTDILLYAKKAEIGFLCMGIVYVFSMLLAGKVDVLNTYMFMIWGMFVRSNIYIENGFSTGFVLVAEVGYIGWKKLKK